MQYKGSVKPKTYSANPRRDIKELMKMKKTMSKKLERTRNQTEKIHLNKNNKKTYNRREKRK